MKDRNHKTDKELIQYVVKAAGYGSNLLLNVGPMPNGKIQPKHVESLKKIGEWLQLNGETIYGTTEGPVAPNSEMVSTQKEKTVYLHVTDSSKDLFFIPNFKERIKTMSFYKNKGNVTYDLNKYGLLIEIPENKKDTIDTIIEITIE